MAAKKVKLSSGGWDSKKVEAFKKAFYLFLNHVKIDSKETGGSTVLGAHIYHAQRRALDAIFSALSEDVHDIKILKSRQLGITTIIEALDVFWLLMHEGLKGAMIFDTSAHMSAARKRVVNILSLLPDSLGFPKIVNDNREGLVLTNRSELLFMSAGVKASKGGGTLGASVGLNFLHCSEMCSWQNDEGIASLQATIARNFPNRLFIWESTARGFNSWHKLWKKAIENPLAERTCFIGWWAKEVQRITEDNSLYKKYGINPPSEDEADRIDEVEQRYGFQIDQEQLAWFRAYSNYNPDDEEDPSGAEDEFVNQNQPWTEDDAFQQTGSSFFSGSRLTTISKETTSEKFTPYIFSLPTEFPLLTVEQCRYAKYCQLKVWQQPDPYGVYILSADPAFGHSETSDRSSIQIIRCFADRVEQVAEYAFSEVRTDQFTWVCAALLGWYGSGKEASCRFILEINGPGEAVWNEYKSLKQRMSGPGYMNYLAQKDGLGNIFANVRNYIYTRTDSMSNGSVFQWKTQVNNKPGLLERLRDFVSNGGLIIRSSALVDEMRGIIREGDKIGASGNNNDDRVMAIAMAIRAWEQYERRALVNANKTYDNELSHRRLTLSDQWSILSRNQFESFFKKAKVAKVREQRRLNAEKWRR